MTPPSKRWKMKPTYLVHKAWGYYWQPSKAVQKLGFGSVALGKDEAKAYAEAREWNRKVEAERNRIAKDRMLPTRGTVKALIVAYKTSLEWERLRERTRRDYDYHLQRIDAWVGKLKPDQISPRAVKTWYHRLWKESPSSANARFRVFRLLWNWGIAEEMVTINPAAEIPIMGTKPRQALWEPWEVEALIAKAEEIGKHSVALAIRIAFDCTQRQGDVLSLTWQQIRDGRVTFVQSKTRKRCRMRLTRDLAEALEQAERKAVHVVINERTGQPYNSRNFHIAFREVRDAAGLQDRWFMDLRRSGMVEAHMVGVSIRDIAARSGHTIDETTAIIETYIPPTDAMADNVIDRLDEAREQRRNRPMDGAMDKRRIKQKGNGAK